MNKIIRLDSGRLKKMGRCVWTVSEKTLVCCIFYHELFLFILFHPMAYYINNKYYLKWGKANQGTNYMSAMLAFWSSFDLWFGNMVLKFLWAGFIFKIQSEKYCHLFMLPLSSICLLWRIWELECLCSIPQTTAIIDIK